ncbi:acetyl/propionyl/methylcrotonyl-CoA carboxylase subunit alpha [Streptomyces yerevanensis]|uniref:acetyl/propionyl/methylcrotonyl-CoA carboxylase subunit alpha n=1 Tax=Streptomyces yerevanensis TaxID=66378 RepID=UPI000525A86A|nr:biotin carboxylase N-terminal domain-containing protein [Streptomyces yerevanensis]
MISSVLVANRGEIACRVFRTCRELGIRTVAVYSDADESALHARVADAAVRLPGAAPSDTYLRGELIVKAALSAGADAVHPGYGFLSENADFARAVLDAGLVWIGPSPEAIEAMASKTRAKELMGLASLTDAKDVKEDDLPVLVKAAAGGGGRGMRVVRRLADLEGELAAARAEALSAFGDDEVFIEPYVEGGRHVEVQILADAHGTVWPLGTRDCSLQRRHQKVIEEAPAPGLTSELTDSLCAMAVRAARAVDYVGAGTVEFLVADDPAADPGAGAKAHFLEMNTRLQVEHPVTEAVFGLDLVALQIRVAEGAALETAPPRARGHAIEARLYAEDPANGWTPQTGTLHRLTVPDVRLDTGYEDGDEIGVHYDPMLAKAVAYAPTRAEALRKLAGALERATIHGPVTNRDLLVRSLRHPEFATAHMDTGFYDRHLPELTSFGSGAPYAPLAAALADAHGRSRFGGWRNLPSQPQLKRYRDEATGTEHEVRYRHTRDGLTADGVRVLRTATDLVVLEADGVRRHFEVTRYGDEVYVNSTALTALPRFPDPTAQQEPGSLLAPMPGTVVRVAEGLTEGSPVRAGEPLIWLEAMKMEHKISAPVSGTLSALHATPGRQVEVGTLLAVVQDNEPPSP